MAVYEAESRRSKQGAIDWSLQCRQDHGALPTIMVADQTDLTDFPPSEDEGPVNWAGYMGITTEDAGEVLKAFNRIVT